MLVLPNIEMNPPQVYMCSPSWTLLPPPSPIPSLWVVPVHQPQASSIVIHSVSNLPFKAFLVKVKSLSCVRLFAIPWTVVYQASLSMGFSRQEYWSGLPFHSPGDLPDPGIKPRSSALQSDTLPSEPPGKPVLFLFASIIRNNIH